MAPSCAEIVEEWGQGGKRSHRKKIGQIKGNPDGAASIDAGEERKDQKKPIRR